MSSVAAATALRPPPCCTANGSPTSTCTSGRNRRRLRPAGRSVPRIATGTTRRTGARGQPAGAGEHRLDVTRAAGALGEDPDRAAGLVAGPAPAAAAPGRGRRGRTAYWPTLISSQPSGPFTASAFTRNDTRRGSAPNSTAPSMKFWWLATTTTGPVGRHPVHPRDAHAVHQHAQRDADPAATVHALRAARPGCRIVGTAEVEPPHRIPRSAASASTRRTGLLDRQLARSRSPPRPARPAAGRAPGCCPWCPGGAGRAPRQRDPLRAGRFQSVHRTRLPAPAHRRSAGAGAGPVPRRRRSGRSSARRPGRRQCRCPCPRPPSARSSPARAAGRAGRPAPRGWPRPGVTARVTAWPRISLDTSRPPSRCCCRPGVTGVSKVKLRQQLCDGRGRRSGRSRRPARPA